MRLDEEYSLKDKMSSFFDTMNFPKRDLLNLESPKMNSRRQESVEFTVPEMFKSCVKFNPERDYLVSLSPRNSSINDRFRQDRVANNFRDRNKHDDAKPRANILLQSSKMDTMSGFNKTHMIPLVKKGKR